MLCRLGWVAICIYAYGNLATNLTWLLLQQRHSSWITTRNPNKCNFNFCFLFQKLINIFFKHAFVIKIWKIHHGATQMRNTDASTCACSSLLRSLEMRIMQNRSDANNNKSQQVWKVGRPTSSTLICIAWCTYIHTYIHTYSSLAALAAAKTSLLQQRAASVKKGTDLTPPPDSEFAWNI